jgi:hypothetical protein
VTTPIAPAALLLGLVAARARTQDERWTFPHPILVVPVAAAAYLGTVLAPVYGQAGTEIPAHTMNLLFHAFCAAVLLSGASIGAWLGARPPGPARRAGSARRWLAPAGAVAVAALAVLPASSARTAWLDLVTGKAGRWDAAMEERYRIVARCLPVCDVPRIADGPETLAWFEDAVDEATDSPFWLDYKDSKYALFFEKYRIRLAAGRAGGSSP